MRDMMGTKGAHQVRRGLLLVSAVLAGGCDDGSASDTAGTDAVAPEAGVAEAGAAAADAGASDDAGSTPQLPCALAEGMDMRTLSIDGETREYIIDVPALPAGDGALPLVVNMHGFGSNANQQRAYMALETTAPWDSSGFVRVYPQGLDSSWNAGDCCGVSVAQDRDDVAFIRSLVGELTAQRCVDANRVYATGMSNGGFMAYRLACEASDMFAAVASVTGVLGLDPSECQPERAVPLFVSHGTADAVVPYEGGDTVGAAMFASAASGVAHFADLHGCASPPEQSFSGEVTTCQRYADCESGGEVIFCSHEGGGHCWPGVEFCVNGTSPLDLSGSEQIIDFFGRHSL